MQYSYSNIQRILYRATREYFLHHLRTFHHTNSQYIGLPKTVKIFTSDFQNFTYDQLQKVYVTSTVALVSSSPPSETLISETSVTPIQSMASSIESKRQISSAQNIRAISSSTEWDRVQSDSKDSYGPKKAFLPTDITRIHSATSVNSRHLSLKEDLQSIPELMTLTSFLELDESNMLSISDYPLVESELQRLTRVLKLGVEVRNRKHLMRTYKSCFTGRSDTTTTY